MISNYLNYLYYLNYCRYISYYYFFNFTCYKFVLISYPMACLQDHEVVSSSLHQNAWSQEKKTFVQVLNNTSNIHLSQLPVPCIKGICPLFRFLRKCILLDKNYKNHLHVRLSWVKVISLNIFWALQETSSLADWKVIPMRKGFYEFVFSSLKNIQRKPGNMKSSTWNSPLCGLRILSPLLWS